MMTYKNRSSTLRERFEKSTYTESQLMSNKQQTSRNSHHKPSPASTPKFRRTGQFGISSEQQFMQLLQHLVATTSKETSNNVALVAIAAMFFGFAVLVIRPDQPPVNQMPLNLQNSSTTTVTTRQQQTQSQSYNPHKAQQMIEEDPPSGSRDKKSLSRGISRVSISSEYLKK
ncbi:hypothetical protein AB0756_39940 [Tolypothrix campylonemoides VB511288_2]